MQSRSGFNRRRGRLLWILPAYLVFLLWTMPASQGYRLLQQRLPALKLETLDGSIWNATATGVEIGTWPLGKVRLRLQPLALLAGRISLRADIDAAIGSLHGLIDLQAGNRFEFKTFDTRLDAQTLAEQLGLDAKLSGTIDLQLKNVRVDGSRLSRAEGAIVWRRAGITSPFRLALGTVRLSLRSRNTVTGVLRNTHPSVRLKGRIRFTAPGRYRLDLSLHGSKGLDPAVSAALDTPLLRRLGIKRSRRGLTLQYNGSF